MGWPAHNPEAWEELEESAIVKWLTRLWENSYGDTKDFDVEMLPSLVLAIREHRTLIDDILEAGAWRDIDETDHYIIETD